MGKGFVTHSRRCHDEARPGKVCPRVAPASCFHERDHAATSDLEGRSTQSGHSNPSGH